VSGARLVVALLLLGAGLGAVAWWWRAPGPGAVSIDDLGDQVQTRLRHQTPVFAATPEVAALYRFARDRGDVLRFVPCTCGCGDLGHASNRACYVKAESPTSVTYTSHAAT
jgi:hypothetical protein